MTMTQERTSYIAKGDAGAEILKQGPMIAKYRGLNIIKSRAFSMEEGAAPRDVLRRRVRTAEFYYGPITCDNTGAEQNDGRVELYDEYTDNFVSLNISKIMVNAIKTGTSKTWLEDDVTSGTAGCNFLLLLRPCIEHFMLGAIFGKGGLAYLGATLWYDQLHGVSRKLPVLRLTYTFLTKIGAKRSFRCLTMGSTVCFLVFVVAPNALLAVYEQTNELVYDGNPRDDNNQAYGAW